MTYFRKEHTNPKILNYATKRKFPRKPRKRYDIIPDNKWKTLWRTKKWQSASLIQWLGEWDPLSRNHFFFFWGGGLPWALVFSRKSKDWHLQWVNGFQQITRQRLVWSWWFFRQTPMKFQFWWNGEFYTPPLPPWRKIILQKKNLSGTSADWIDLMSFSPWRFRRELLEWKRKVGTKMSWTDMHC